MKLTGHRTIMLVLVARSNFNLYSRTFHLCGRTSIIVVELQQNSDKELLPLLQLMNREHPIELVFVLFFVLFSRRVRIYYCNWCTRYIFKIIFLSKSNEHLSAQTQRLMM
jgi:hypothetical protein